MLPKAKVDVKCAMCGLAVHPLVARYLWVGWGWRGRPSPKPHATLEATYCGPCADMLIERMGPFMTWVELPTGAGG